MIRIAGQIRGEVCFQEFMILTTMFQSQATIAVCIIFQLEILTDINWILIATRQAVILRIGVGTDGQVHKFMRGISLAKIAQDPHPQTQEQGPEGERGEEERDGTGESRSKNLV